MSTAMHTATDDEDRVIPLVLSLGLHTLIAVAVIWLYNAPTVTEPPSMETALISAGEFAEIEGLLQQSASAAGVKGDNSATLPTASPEVSSSMQDYNPELAERQAAFEAQMAEYAAALDAEMAADIAAYDAAVKELVRDQQQAVKDGKRAERNHEQTIKRNQAELDKARERRDRAIEAHEAAVREQGGTSGSLSDGKAPTNDTPQTGGTGATRTTASISGGGGSANDLAGRVSQHIYPHWQVPKNANGERLNARVRVDDSGNVLSVSISGGSEALRDSLESAIRSSSPITPLVGSGFKNLSVSFVAR